MPRILLVTLCQLKPQAKTMLFSLCLMLQGCAYTYVDDDDGQIHTVGLMHVTMPEENAGIAGTIVDLTTVGVSIVSGPDTASLAIGYNREVLGAIKDNSLVILNKSNSSHTKHFDKQAAHLGEEHD
jgi:hypothetical protein